MRATCSFQLPGIAAVASLAGGLLLTGCSSNGLMIYKNTKHVESVSGVSHSMSRGLFGLKNGSVTKQEAPVTKAKPTMVTSLKPVTTTTRKIAPYQPAHKYYIIQKGDTLSQIALDHKVGIDELASLNNIHKDDMIRVGQKLTLPYGAVVGQRTVTTKQEAKSPTVGYYTVQKGDFLGKIALKTKTSVADLKTWNNLNSDKIQVGWKLALGPGGSPKITKPGSSVRATKEIPADGIHVVQSGDSISKIATMYKGLTSSKLKALNGLSDNRIVPGQKLKLQGDIVEVAERGITPPVATPVQPETETVAAPTVSSVPGISLPHFVDQQNDTLKSVAEMYGSKVEWILAKNPSIKTDSDLRGVKEISVPVME